MLQGVYTATKKDKTLYYRSSITYKNKHISLGSYESEPEAGRAYSAAASILNSHDSIEDSFYHTYALAFDKIVTLINYRDNGMYIKTPIYLRKNYFSYYMDISCELKFDIDDLFYYSEHRILRRQGHLYVNDYGMQVTLLSRYGIQPHAVCGRDYVFVNSDSTDMRYENIKLLNPYHGVEIVKTAGLDKYKTRIHVNGNFVIGTYSTIERAAIAYNKAVDIAHSHGLLKNYHENYIENISPSEYADIYTTVSISDKFVKYLEALT